jgi:Fe-S-cluster-containing hydrogenase component 2
MVCARNCTAGAITGEKKQPHVIDPELCTRCGLCMQVCKFNGVMVY